MTMFLGTRNKAPNKSPMLPASYHGPWRDTIDPMFVDETPTSLSHPLESPSTTHNYPPKPRSTTAAPLSESPTQHEPPQAESSTGFQSLSSAPAGQTKHSNNAPEDDEEDERHGGLKVRLVAQQDRQQEKQQEANIAMIMQSLEGLQTTVSNQI